MGHGLIFNRKGDDVNRKHAESHDFDNHDINKIGHDLHFGNSGAERKFKEMLRRSKDGGIIRREEVHDSLQKLVATGEITESKAMEIAKETGLESKRFRYFEDKSEYNDRHPNKNNFPAEEEGRVISNGNLKEIEKSSTNPVEKKSIWSFLNNKKH